MIPDEARTPLTTPLGSGRTLIEASAGSGKTRAITSLFARMVVERGLEIDQILVVTFTKAATAELRERIRATLKVIESARGKAANATDDQARELLERWEQLPGLDAARIRERIELALLDIDRANIQTIHGFCQRALTEFAFETGFSFDFELSGDGGGLVEGVVRDFWQRKYRNSSRILARFLAKKGFLPGHLAGWYASLRAKDFAEIRGAPESAQDPAEAENLCREKLQAFIAIWREHGAAFKEIMLESEALNRRSYRNDTIRNHLGTIQRVAAEGELPLSMIEGDGLAGVAKYFGANDLARKCKKGHEPPENPLFAAFDELADACKTFTESLESGLRFTRKQLIEHAGKEVRRIVREQKRLGYDDLLLEMRQALDREGSGGRLAANIRRRFPAALIDEFQDTDPTQARIFAAIYGGGDGAEPAETADDRGALYIVGDPKQAIYKFRGADIFAYLAAQRGAALPLELGSNYRSTPGLVEACNAIFAAPWAFAIPEIGFSPATPGRDSALRLEIDGETPPPMQFWLLQDYTAGGKASDVAANKTADDIIRLLKLAGEGKAKIGGKPLAASDIAVLVAKKADGRMVARELRRRGGRCVEIDDSSIFDSREAGQVYRLLLALANRGRQDFRRAALTGDVFGLGNEDLLALIEADDYWSHWAEQFDQWHRDWVDKGVGAMLRKIIGAQLKRWPEVEQEASGESGEGGAGGEEIRVGTGNLLNSPAGPRRLTNFYHLTELLQEAETENQYSPARLLAWLRRRMMGEAESRPAEENPHTLRLDSDENLVKISTIHKSKGLEYPIVYLPFAWYSRQVNKTSADRPIEYHTREDGRFPAVLDLAPDAAGLAKHKLEEFSSSVRLLYVALTRARERCVIAWTRITRDPHGKETPPLAWLLHRDEHDEKTLAEDGGPEAANSAIPDSATKVLPQINYSFRTKERGEFNLDMEALQRQCSHGIKLGDKDSATLPTARLDGTAGELELTAPREFDRPLRRIRRMTSYTDLAAEHPAATQRFSEAAAADHDQSVDAASADAAEAESTKTDAFHFPRGARVGNCFHRIFELHDQEPGRMLNDICAEQLLRAGIDLRKWLRVALNIVENTLSTELREPGESGRAGFRLADIDRRLTELEFFFPVKGVSRSGLAAALARSGYPELLREVPGEPAIDGFLRGFIDLTFEHEGRWYIADYKSNHLGDQAQDYEGEPLKDAMRQHSYQLQYLLYLLALHRYLRTRIRGYDYERHIGGVFYLFLRGVAPATGMSRGVWFDRPEKACIEALDEFMESAGS